MLLRNRFNLMGSVYRAPVELSGMGSFGGESGGGGAAGGQPAGGQTQDDNSHVPLFGQEGNDEDNGGGLDDLLNAFKGEGDDDDNEPDDTSNDEGGLSGVPQDRVDSLQAEIQSVIKNARIPDDAIPEDFDPSDRRQLTAVMNRAVQAALAQSLNITFKPVQLALQHMAEQFDQRVDQKINSSRDSLQAQNILEDMVPEVNNPKYRPMIQNLEATLKANGKKPKERAATIRKMLNQMGIRDSGAGGNRRSSNPNGNGSSQVKTGVSALDSFFGKMPTFK